MHTNTHKKAKKYLSATFFSQTLITKVIITKSINLIKLFICVFMHTVWSEEPPSLLKRPLLQCMQPVLSGAFKGPSHFSP